MKRGATPGEVRLIGGQWKRSKLPVAERPGLRPTPDRVRETLFNWLGQDLTGWVVLDAFAGSGALGFEAASRGAERVLMIEADAGLARSLAQTARRLNAAQVQVLTTDAMRWMAQAAVEGAPVDRTTTGSAGAALVGQSIQRSIQRSERAPSPAFDLILLDPPFEADLFEAAWKEAIPLLRPGGWLYLEAPAQWTLEAANLELHRHLKAGAVHAHLWKCSKAPRT